MVQSFAGSILVIPREKWLVRLYIQLQQVKLGSDGVIDRSNITPDSILAAAKKIVAPYTIDYHYCDWWTAYQVAQRVGTAYSDLTKRVLLAGDAVHTHSPKGGQGMNVSMQDTYNLCWKLGAVLNGQMPRAVVATYEAERRPIAHQLIEFDHKASRVFSGKPSGSEVYEIYMENSLSIANTAVKYAPSNIVAASSRGVTQEVDEIEPQLFSAKLVLGVRFPYGKVIYHADGRPVHIQELLHSDGRWRVIVFAGDITQTAQFERLDDFGDKLSAPGGLLSKYTYTRPPRDLIEVLLVHRNGGSTPELTDYHNVYLPFDAREGYNYSKILIDASETGQSDGTVYEQFGVDPAKGCVVLTRPDSHVAYIGEIEDVVGLEDSLRGVCCPRRVRMGEWATKWRIMARLDDQHARISALPLGNPTKLCLAY